jgi:four helix bundle protein
MSVDKHHQLRERTKAFALRVIKMSQALPRTREANVLSQQILRSATSMAANYRAAGRSRSKAEFVAKLGVVIEESDETVFWLEMLVDAGFVRQKRWKTCKPKPTNYLLSLPPHAEPRRSNRKRISMRRTR